MMIWFWFIVALLCLQFMFDFFLISNMRQSVRECEEESDDVKAAKEDILRYKSEIEEMIKLINEVISGDEAETEGGGTAAGSAASGADTDPYLVPVKDELPGTE